MWRGNRWPLVGTFRYLAREDRWEWSDEVARMHGYEPGRVAPSTDLLLAHVHPAEQLVVRQLVDRVQQREAAFSNRLRIVDAGGNVHVVVVLGNPWYDDDGKLGGTVGFYIDITHQFEVDVQKRMTETLDAITARRAMINQAMGILMACYGLNAESAFQLLTKLSQKSNVKLRVLAERIVAGAGTREPLFDDAVAAVDRLLHLT